MTTAPTTRDRQGFAGGSATDSLRVLGAIVVGVVMLITAFAYLNRIPGWADQHGAVWVYLGFFVYMSIAGRLFWWGLDQLLDRLRTQRGTGR
ncbi:hypothetical protein [Nocardia brasiliensis]|uniref:Integral membrane protein n=1 Tax=Nocardia brasiliensis (strain ATCC 700358 / HUJEG-1) TaxID=1133849 RepID=K0F9I5_NOCB7|nr:hypothetical protein [Nocardia brasiliensis]AFU06040.1 hypothetical protein O3I_040475 [Nocardia brasiliensis ATCC 700358]OCF90186.1 hypothetical protein AW168_13810 [Nocardia brasiliensis]